MFTVNEKMINEINVTRKAFKCNSNETVFNGVKIRELLKQGVEKIGKNVWHFSTLPTCENGGTCFCTCENGYCQKGRYNMESVKESLKARTNIVRADLQYFVNEAVREIRAHKVKFVRIHVTGDFFCKEYCFAWYAIIKACPGVTFWTYTKSYGYGFDDAIKLVNSLPNCNIVESDIPGCGYNFGHCDYILDTYYKLLLNGDNPYICPCGTDPTVHCNDCHKCAERKHVLFLEHGTKYKAAKDPLFSKVAEIVKESRCNND